MLHTVCNNVGQVCNPHEHPIAGWYMLRFIFKLPTHLHLGITVPPWFGLSLKQLHVGERTGLVVRASDSGSGDPGSILGQVGVLSP